MLKQETLVDLVRQAQAGDLAARNTVVTANIKFVAAIARRIGRGMRAPDREDLESEGVLGLLHAVETWDPEGETKFSTHAGWKIRNSIRKAKLRIDGVKVTSQLHRKVAARISRVQQRRQAQGLPCGAAELAGDLGVSVKVVAQYLADRNAGHVASLDAPVRQDDTHTLGEVVPQTTFLAPGDETESEERQRARWAHKIYDYAQGLGGMGGEILRARLDEIPMTEVAKRIGISKQKLHDISKVVLRRARHDLRDLWDEVDC